MITPITEIFLKDEAIAPENIPNSLNDQGRIQSEVSKVKKRYKLNRYGYILNFVLLCAWLYMLKVFINRLFTPIEIMKIIIFHPEKGLVAWIILCDSILAGYHFLYCLVPSFGAGDHSLLKVFIPTMAVISQVVSIYYSSNSIYPFFANYMWSVLVLGPFCVYILASNESDSKESLVMYFKPWHTIENAPSGELEDNEVEMDLGGNQVENTENTENTENVV